MFRITITFPEGKNGIVLLINIGTLGVKNERIKNKEFSNHRR